MVHLDDEHKGTLIHGTMARWFHSPSSASWTSLCRQQDLPSFMSSWFNKTITIKIYLQFCFIEVISNSLILQSVTVQLNVGMEKGTGKGAEKGRWKVSCSHSLTMQPQPLTDSAKNPFVPYYVTAISNHIFIPRLFGESVMLLALNTAIQGLPARHLFLLCFSFGLHSQSQQG